MEREVSIKAANLSMVYPKRYYRRTVHNGRELLLRCCTNCGRHQILQEMMECMDCRSVFYCSRQCQIANYFAHCQYCKLYKKFIKMEYKLMHEMDALFEFDNLMLFTRPHEQREHYFLRTMNLQPEGIWTRFCSCNEIKFGMEIFWGNPEFLPKFFFEKTKNDKKIQFSKFKI